MPPNQLADRTFVVVASRQVEVLLPEVVSRSLLSLGGDAGTNDPVCAGRRRQSCGHYRETPLVSRVVFFASHYATSLPSMTKERTHRRRARASKMRLEWLWPFLVKAAAEPPSRRILLRPAIAHRAVE